MVLPTWCSRHLWLSCHICGTSHTGRILKVGSICIQSLYIFRPFICHSVPAGWVEEEFISVLLLCCREGYTVFVRSMSVFLFAYKLTHSRTSPKFLHMLTLSIYSGGIVICYVLRFCGYHYVFGPYGASCVFLSGERMLKTTASVQTKFCLAIMTIKCSTWDVR